jgi:hypothetical protein
MPAPGRTERIAGAALTVVRGVVRRMPAGWRKALDDRFFGAIFQVTRVTNDAYGWKPPAGGSPFPGGDASGVSPAPERPADP